MITKIFIDMDGVIANFHAHYYMTFKPKDESWWYDIPQECDPILQGVAFWAHIPLMPDAKQIVAKCIEVVGQKNVAFLTSPGRWPHSYIGKHKWLAKHFQGLESRLITADATCKDMCASPNSVIIEDRVATCELFQSAGGSAVLVPRPWNRDFELVHVAYEVFVQRLKGVMSNAEGVIV